MRQTIARRISKLEQRVFTAVPHVLEIDGDETEAEALARFVERHGSAPTSLIVVPARVSNVELPKAERRWIEQQRRLMANARSATAAD
jgi:hypothetical protein